MTSRYVNESSITSTGIGGLYIIALPYVQTVPVHTMKNSVSGILYSKAHNGLLKNTCYLS
jgi:hypothetical protein